jgi:hypothetical protein
MMMRANVSSKDDGQTLLFVDSSAFYPLALDDSLLKRSGADLANFRSQPGAPPSWKMGPLPFFKLGNVDLSQFPAVQGAPFTEYKQIFDVELGGVAGAGLLSVFRVTFADDGRWLWLELDPAMLAPSGPPPPPGAPPPVPPPELEPRPKVEPQKRKLDPPKAEPPKAEAPKPEKPKADSKGAAK